MPRFLCRPCRKTHSVLPTGLPPICRWLWKDILTVSSRLAQGESAYALAKSLGKSLRVLIRLKSFLSRAAPVVEALSRSMGFLDGSPSFLSLPKAMTLTDRWPSWQAFTHCFSRILYPARHGFWSTHTIRTG